MERYNYHTDMPHIGPSGYQPGHIGYKFDLTLDDCKILYVPIDDDHRRADGQLVIMPPEGKQVHLQIGAQVRAAPAMQAALEKWVRFFRDNKMTDADYHDGDGKGWITPAVAALARSKNRHVEESMTLDKLFSVALD